MLRIAFQLVFDTGRRKNTVQVERMVGMQHFIPRQSSVDNSHTLYKVNLIFCELNLLWNTQIQLSDFTYILVFSRFSRQVAYFTAFKNKQFSQSVSNSPFFSTNAWSDVIQKVIYVVWLPHCHRSKLIRCVICHTRLSRGSLRLQPFHIDSRVLGKTVVQSYSHSPSPTECKEEPWLNYSS